MRQEKSRFHAASLLISGLYCACTNYVPPRPTTPVPAPTAADRTDAPSTIGTHSPSSPGLNQVNSIPMDSTEAGVRPAGAQTPWTETGMATYYSSRLAGRKTSSGERYDPDRRTAAHRTLPLGSLVRVTRLDTGHSVVVRVNDRGPFGSTERVIDLSLRAARELHMVSHGVVRVRIDLVSRPN